MSTVQDDLWPDELRTTEVLSPQEILQAQAVSLEVKTNGLLTAKVDEDLSEDRRIYRFVVTSPRLEEEINLFELHLYKDLAYPVAIIPPDLRLPDYLKSEVYEPGFGAGALTSMLGIAGKWVKNERVAGSPAELKERLQKLFASAAVKSLMMSMLAKATHHAA